jgi:ribonucleoside-diphosphate reductase alpha chain
LVHNIPSNGNGIIEREAPKRPKTMPCDVHRMAVASHSSKDKDGNRVMEKWIAFVGLYKEKPYEIFVGKINDVNLPKNIINGELIKIKQGHYSFVYEGEVLIANISKTFDNLEHDAFARLVSTALRHGVPLNFVVSQMNKAQGTIVDFSKTVSRTLKKYIDDGENAGICEYCGGKMLFIEGCVKCSNPECGNAKCG